MATVTSRGPDPRPLGALALAASVLALLSAVSVFLSPLAFLVALPALWLGWAARSVEQTRRMGTVSLIVTALAVLAAAGVLVSMFLNH